VITDILEHQKRVEPFQLTDMPSSQSARFAERIDEAKNAATGVSSPPVDTRHLQARCRVRPDISGRSQDRLLLAYRLKK